MENTDLIPKIVDLELSGTSLSKIADKLEISDSRLRTIRKSTEYAEHADKQLKNHSLSLAKKAELLNAIHSAAVNGNAQSQKLLAGIGGLLDKKDESENLSEIDDTSLILRAIWAGTDKFDIYKKDKKFAKKADTILKQLKELAGESS